MTTESKIELPTGRVVGIREAGDGPTLVQIHGLGTGHQNLDALTPLLAEHLHVMDVDLPGYNDSDPLPQDRRSIDGFADAVAELLTARELGPVPLHGTSMGGLVVLSLAARYPELAARLVVTVSFARADRASRQIFETWKIAGAAGARPLAEVTSQQGFARGFWDADDAAEIKESFVEAMRTTSPEGFLRDLELMDDIDVTQSARQVRVPTLLIGAREDIMTPVDPTPSGVGMRGLAALIPDSRLEIVDDAGHFLLFERPDAVASLMVAFLAARPPRSRAPVADGG